MSTIVGAEHPPMTLYRALLLLGGEWTSSGVVRHLDPALILAEAWVPYRLQRCRDHLAVGRQAPAIAVVGFRLPARRVLYGVSDGLHRTVAHREAEPPRDFRRLQLLRDWSHDEAYPTLFP